MIDEDSVVLSHFSLKHVGLEERLAAAQAAGFKFIGLYVDAFLASEQAGLTPSQQRQLAERHEVVVAEVEALRPWWNDAARRERAELAEHTCFQIGRAAGRRRA